MENRNRNKSGSTFVGTFIDVPKNNGKGKLPYKQLDAEFKFLKKLRDWMNSDEVKRKRSEGQKIGVGVKTLAYEDNRDENGLGAPLQTIEKAQVVFYLWDHSRSNKGKFYKQPYNPDQNNQHSTYVQPQQNVVNKFNEQAEEIMDDPLPTQREPGDEDDFNDRF